MPYSEEAGEEPGPENFNLALLQRETLARNGRLRKIDETAEKERQVYSDKLKQKLDSVSNPYFIAPYDSLQLYHYEVRTPGRFPHFAHAHLYKLTVHFCSLILCKLPGIRL